MWKGRTTAEVLAEAERIFLGRYVIDAPLPWNGFAFVFRAVEPGRAVAVAALPVDLSSDEQRVGAFRKRVADLATLRHPALPVVTDAGVEQGVPFVEMDFAPGRPLTEVVGREGALEPARAFAVADAVLDLLETAHDRRWMHWDLTPSNVLLAPAEDGGERVAVIGLGFRALVGGEAAAGLLPSGPRGERFVAPEVLRGQPDGRSDLFSVGALLHFMLTGARPPAPGASARRAGWARPVVERALAARSADRFADARSMRTTLRKAFEGHPVSRPRRRPLGRPVLWAAAASLCLAAGAVGTLGWLQWKERSTARAEGTVTSPPPKAQAAPQPQGRVGAEPAERGEPSQGADSSDERSPLATGLPQPLREIGGRIDEGDARLTREELAPVVEYVREHPDDPRGHLLLGHAFATLEWHSDAMGHYVRAYRADPRSRHDGRVLEALLEALPHRDLHERAARAVTLIYGREAIAPLERFLDETELPWVEHRRVLAYLERLKTRFEKEGGQGR